MKVKINNYSFDASAKKIVFSDYSKIELDSILIISNATSGVLIYSFADPLLNGTAQGNMVTLEYNTASMSDTDELVIYYDDKAYDQNVLSAKEIYRSEQLAAQTLLFSEFVDPSSGRLRVMIDPLGGAQTLGTVTTVGTVTTCSTVTTLSNQTSIGGNNAATMILDLMDSTWANCIRRNIY